MIRYFIENELGEWLKPLAEFGSKTCWTRDPLEAWVWEEHREPLKWLTRPSISNGPVTSSFSWGIIDLSRPGTEVLNWLIEEGCSNTKNWKITEHEFINLSNDPSNPSDLYRCNRTYNMYLKIEGNMYLVKSQRGEYSLKP